MKIDAENFDTAVYTSTRRFENQRGQRLPAQSAASLNVNLSQAHETFRKKCVRKSINSNKRGASEKEDRPGRLFTSNFFGIFAHSYTTGTTQA